MMLQNQYDLFCVAGAGTQLKNILWYGKNTLRGGDKRTFGGGGKKFIKSKKISSNSENFRGQDCWG